MLTRNKVEGTVVFVLWGVTGPLGRVIRLPDFSQRVEFNRGADEWDEATEAEIGRVYEVLRAVHQLKRSHAVAVLVGHDSSGKPIWAEGFFEALLSMRDGPLFSVKLVAWPGIAYSSGLAEHVLPLGWAKYMGLQVVDYRQIPNDVIMLEPLKDDEAVSSLFHFCLMLIQQTDDNDIRFTLASFSDQVIASANRLLSKYGRTIVQIEGSEELAIRY